MEANVKKLLEAEKKANDLVNAALREKQQKLKEAKVVAEEKLEKFKDELEVEFEKQKKEKYGDSLDPKELEKDTLAELHIMRGRFDKFKDDFEELLVQTTMDVDLEIPLVVKGDFSSLLKD